MKQQRGLLTGAFYLLFFLSGIAGLVYQTLWLRMFTLILGNSLHSSSIVFSSFMCGLAAGAWLFGKLARDRKDLLALYILLELGIALTALAVGKSIPYLNFFVPWFHRSLSGSPLLLALFRGALSFAILIVPTALLGGTLPVMAHFLTRRLELAGRRIGALYGWNTVGAVLGCVLAGFWLLRVYGMSATLYAAVAVNLFVAAAAAALRLYSRGIPARGDSSAADRSPGRNIFAGAGGLPTGLKRILRIAAALTGAASLALEVVWARFLSYILHSDIFTLYLMLSTMLFGIGLGSLVYSRLLDRVKNRLRLLAFLEIALGLTVVLSYLFCAFLYLRPGNALFHNALQNFFSHIFANEFYTLTSIRLIYTLAAMFVPAVIMGIVFPLICRLYLADEKSIGRDTGLIYAVNTAGAVAGALAAGFFLVPGIGVQASLFIMAALNLLLGLTVCFYEVRSGKRKASRAWVLSGAAVTVLFCILCLTPGNKVRQFAMKDKNHADLIYYREGISGTVSVFRDRINGLKTLYINSLAEVLNDLAGMQTFKVMGHLPLLLHEGEAQDVLMVTFGGGIASGAVSCHAIERLDVVELEGAVVEASSSVYSEENRGVAGDPRIHIHLEDGRNYLAATDRLYDVIISDATNPASTDSWLLFTIEFYKLCLERLEKGGIMAQWLPLHTGSPDTYCNIAKAFQQVFPHASLWIMKDYTLIMGLPETLSISYPELAGKLAAEPVRSDLEPYCLAEPLELLDCFLMGENALGRMVRDARVSTDNLPLYQAESDKRPVGEILSMLAQHRERVFPFLRGMEGPQARAVRDSLELYFQAQAHLLRRDYAGAFRANPASCKYAEFYRDYQEEVPYIEALAACDPENNRTLLRLGTTLVRHREYSRAREVFAKLVSLNPGDRSLYSTLGNIDFKIGDYENSALNYGRARKLGGTLSQESTINLGMALLASGSQGQGIDVLASAVERDSTDVEALLYLGIGLNHAGEAGRAAACFEKVLELDPANLEAILDLATIYLGQGKLSRAEALFGRAVRIAPESPLAWEGLGKALYGLGRPLEARAAFERLLEISPGNRTALKFLEKKDSIP